ncbi:MAG: HAD hydrolase-like protein [Desulfuromonadales bacterium]
MTRESRTPETFTFHISLFTLNLEPKKRAVFLDRDGTINVEKEYLFRIEDFEFIEGAPELKAAEEHRIELGISYMVGDKAADIEAGQKAGCTSLLVLTGYGPAEGAGLEGVPRFPDLAGAADFILSRGGPKR